MRTALIVGNGLTKSLLTHLQIPICSSTPFGWDLPSPISRPSSLIEDFPDLKKYISQSNELGILDDFEILGHLVKNSFKSSLTSPFPSGADFEQSAILDSAHFLALAYSWLQLEIDKHSMENWEWARWLSANYRFIVGALSWNYDLVLERLIECVKSPYFYTPAIPTPLYVDGIKYNRSAIPISKPHGSCNFSTNINFSTSSSELGSFQPLSYPRSIHVTGFNGPIKILRPSELYKVRQVADLILPGEWNRFSQHLKSISDMYKHFSSTIQNADQLIVVGFSMMASDREEFLMAINKNSLFKKIVIVDPCPSCELISVLKDRTKNLQIKTSGVPD